MTIYLVKEIIVIYMGMAEDLIISIKFGKKENLAITYFKANKR
jgi:hypothetical protein